MEDGKRSDVLDPRRRTLWIVAAVVALVLAVVALVLATTGTDGDGVGFVSLLTGSGDPAALDGSATGTLGSGASASADTDTAGGGSSDGGGASAGGATGGGSTAGDGSSPGGGSGETPDSTTGFMLRLAWWNETEDRAPSAMLVTWGGGTWRPTDPSASEVAKIGPMKVGKTFDLKVYPDGPGGAEIVVPVTITDSMRSGSEVDGIHIEVTDDLVRVLGIPVDNFEQIHERP